MSIRKKNKPNKKGRNDNVPWRRFVRLGHDLLNQPAYRALSPTARALLVELAMLDNGRNNGSLYLSVRDGADRLGLVDMTAVRHAFDELQELGFIALTKDACFHVKASENSRARCWRLTWIPVPKQCGATNEYADRQPNPKTKARKRMEAGLRALKRYRQSRDAGRLPVRDSDTLAPN